MKLQDSDERNGFAIRTHEEIAAILAEQGHPMCRGRVWQLEKRALQKIARHPAIRQLAYEAGILKESEVKISR